MQQLLTTFTTQYRPKSLALALGIVLAMAIALGFVVHPWQWKDANPIHIALAVPLNKETAESSQEIVRSVQLYIDSVNQKGGVKGHLLKLLVFDDKNDPTVAQQKAGEIVKSRAVVLLGHPKSNTSIAAGPLYYAFHLPAITATANADAVTQDNPYYFRTIYDNSLLSKVIVLYAQQVLKFRTASIIYGDDALGHELVELLGDSFKQSGTVKHTWEYKYKGSQRQQSIKNIVDALAADPEPGIVFLAMQDEEAADLIAGIRRRGIKAPLFGDQTFGKEAFTQRFKDYPEEKELPGFFTNGIYVPTPLLYDSTNADTQELARVYEQMYGKRPLYYLPKFYDAATLAVHAIQKADIKNTPASLEKDREQIKNQLAALNKRDTALQGLSGPLYFNPYRSMNHPVRIGTFEQRQFISAPVQFTLATQLARVDVNRELKAGNLLKLASAGEEVYFWRQDVVYTGIDINSISRIDQSKSNFSADFYLWFRNRGNADATAVELPGGTRSQQSQPLYDPNNPLESATIDGLNYRLYQVHGEFKNSFDLHDYPFDRQKLAIRLQNNRVPSDRLIYVIDTFGLRLPSADKDAQKKPYESLQLWKFQDIQYARETFRTTSTEGDPRLFDTNNRIDYPGLSATITLQRRSLVFLVKNLLPLMMLMLVPKIVLYFPPKLSKERPPVVVSTLISGTVLLVGLYNQLPDVGYSTALEYAFYVFFGLSLFSILVGIVSDRLLLAKQNEAAKQLDYAARTIYVLVVLFTIASYWYAFSNRLA